MGEAGGGRVESLFVYGTLRKGFNNEYAAMLARSAHFAGRGKVRGVLYLIAHYPGLNLSACGADDRLLLSASAGDKDWVIGEIYHLDDSGKTLRTLDHYEGSEQFKRVAAPVLMDSGAWIQAHVYIYSGDTSGKQRIASGDFVEWRAAKSS
jgi:gamma-glutamylcyclotransferase (GGCT)/AIG2-like uncharacterized protein YtfP